jgi:TATA-box binding protein (TBP) (component of TFIID and TFIIIB)
VIVGFVDMGGIVDHYCFILSFDIKNEQNLGKIPRVYINTDVENEECYLLVYRAHNASVCILIKNTIRIMVTIAIYMKHCYVIFGTKRYT